MADAVYQALDRMVPALEDLQIRGIFNKVSSGVKLCADVLVARTRA